MNKNTLRLILSGALLGALLSPTALFALGLGELRLNSALNQPFDAEIDIASATPDELNSIRVTMANDDTFKRSGLDRPAFLSAFTLRVENSGGHPVIKVRSNVAVSEPFVNLLVDVSWTGGRVLRQYTVLLDPPVFASTPTTDESSMETPRGQTQEPTPASGTIERTPVAAPAEETPSTAETATPPTTSAPASTSSVTPMPTPSAAPIEESISARPSTSQPSYPSADSYTVKSGDTLSKIAAQLRGEGVTTKQLMVALYRGNTAAFGNDMNVLRSGTVLRIPPAADVEAISASDASAEVSRQYGIWRNSAISRQAAAPTAPSQGERLRLVPAQQTASAQASASSAASKAAAAEKAANEQATHKAAEEAEAKRLLELKNAELAKMQKQLSSSASSTATKPVAEAMASVSSSAASVAESAPAAAEPAPTSEAAAQETEIAATKPVKPVAAPESSILDTLQDYWMQILGAGVVVILLLIIYFRRKRTVHPEPESAIATMTAQDFDEQLRGGSRSRSRGFADTRGDIQPEPKEEPQDFDGGRFEAPTNMTTVRREPVSQHVLSEDTLSSETALHIEQQDALAEADFHMAYGLYDQAADIVKLAIERDPERRDLMLKLAEIYFVWGNRDMFLDAAHRLYDTRQLAAPGEWDKVVIMGKQICPDDALFRGDRGRSSSSDSVDVNLEGGEHRVDVDLYDAPSGEQPKSNVDFELERSGNYDRNQGDAGLDFLLDEPQRGVDNEPTREMDPNARTQETPTIEAPYLNDLPDTGSQTIREQFDVNSFGANDRTHDQTSEIALDEIGLHVDNLETTDRISTTGLTHTIGDDEATRIAKREDLERTVETPRPDMSRTMLAPHMDDFADIDMGNEEKTSSTITVEQIDLNDASGMIDMTDAAVSDSGMFKPTQKIDVNMGRFDVHSGDTIEQLRPDLAGSGIYRATQRIDMDFAGLDQADMEATKQLGQLNDLEDPARTSINKGLTSVRPTPTYAPTEAMEASLELPEMEPVTMSEVGTKLDLARAYMDMGDPDGARSILKEVMDEGNPGQKQEAQRLLESIG